MMAGPPSRWVCISLGCIVCWLFTPRACVAWRMHGGGANFAVGHSLLRF